MSQPCANLLGALKEGYFWKCGDKHKTWKVRWFVLTKDILYYFEKETSTEPLGIIPLKDYQRCKGTYGDALRHTGKENSFFLQTPYRMYKCYCQDFKTSEAWAEAIEHLGEFLKKKEELRRTTRYQQEIMRLTNDVINYGSSLIHWFKLVVDSTPSYKAGIRTIYASAIYDIPRELGEQCIYLVKASLQALISPNSPDKLENVKFYADKVMMNIDKAEGFVVCCADAHKVNFTSDLDAIRKAVRGLLDLPLLFPLNEITDASVTLCKTAFAVSQKYVAEEDPIIPPPRTQYHPTGPPLASSSSSARRDSAPLRPFGARLSTVPQPAAAPAKPAPPPEPTPALLLEQSKAAVRTFNANLDTLKGRPLFGTEQSAMQQAQASTAKLDAATTELANLLKAGEEGGYVNGAQVAALYHDIPNHCREVINSADKLFVDPK